MLPAEDQARKTDSPKYGDTALKLGYLTPERLNECLEIRQKMRSMGVDEPLGRILLKKGYITGAQHNEVLRYIGAAPDPIPGYRLIKQIAQGGMGVVYKAEQTSVRRIVAIKILSPEAVKDPAYLDRFFKEARAAAQIDHRNLVGAIDAGQSNGLYYFVMEYVEGKDCRDLVTEKGPFDERKTLDIALQMAEALECIHAHQLVHRDIKPENILLTPDGTVKLCDLGLAKSTSAKEQSLTQTGFTVGTPFYMSPEQIRGDKDIDIRADLYSLGAALYCIVTGRPPFEGRSAGETLTMHLKEPMPDPRKFAPHLSEDFVGILRKLMAKDPRERYATPSLLADDIRRVMAGAAPVLARAHAARSAVLGRAVSSTARVVVKKTVPVWPFVVAGAALAALAAVAAVTVVSRGKARDDPALVTAARRLMEAAEAQMKEGRWAEALATLHELRARYRRLLWYAGNGGVVGEMIGRCEKEIVEEETRKKERRRRKEESAGGPPPEAPADDPAWVMGASRMMAAAEEHMRSGRWADAREVLLDLSSSYASLAWYRQHSARLGEMLGQCEVKIREEGEKRLKERDARPHARTAPQPAPAAPPQKPNPEPPVAPGSLVFQDGVSPGPDYAGTRDTTLRQDSPDRACGKDPNCITDADEPKQSGLVCAALFRWDISAVPGDAAVEYASIVLYSLDRSSNEYSVYRALRPWDEETATWKNAGAGTPWEKPGAGGPGDRGGEVLARIRVTAPGYLEIPLSAAGLAVVQSWIADPSSNFGIVVAPDRKQVDGLDVASREAEDPRHRPRLVLRLRPG